MDAVKSLNGEMWIFASLLIAVVILQAVLFLRLALRVNKKHQYFTREEIGHFLKMGSLSVLGPAFSVVVVAISLIAMVGSGLTFMRVGVIGAASYEMMIATTAAETIGVPFGSPEFSESVLVLCGFGMAFASIPYFITTPIELIVMDKAAQRTTAREKKKRSFSTAEMYAGMRRLLVPQRRRDLGLTPPCQVVPNGRNPFFYKRSDAKCCVRNESTACSNIWSRSALSRW